MARIMYRMLNIFLSTRKKKKKKKKWIQRVCKTGDNIIANAAFVCSSKVKLVRKPLLKTGKVVSEINYLS